MDQDQCEQTKVFLWVLFFVELLDFHQEEKSNLSAEFEHLQAQMGSRATGGPVDSGIRYRK
jgi:hypothetical protein